MGAALVVSVLSSFAVRLAQQRVEAVVEARTKAAVGHAARAELRAFGVILLLRGDHMLVVVADGLVDVVLLQGAEETRLLLERRAVPVVASCAAVSANLVSIYWYCDRQAALAAVSPAL